MEHTLLQWAHQLGTLEYWQTLLDRFGDLGPLAPITLAVVESFFPPLPLIAIVALNVGAHGGILGFLYSWIGVALGGTLMFLLWRRIVKRCFLEDRRPLAQAGKSPAVGQPLRHVVAVHAYAAALCAQLLHASGLRHLGL